MDGLLIFAGVIVSILVQFIKKYFGSEGPMALLIVVLISLAAGTGIWYFQQQTELWNAFTQILLTAGAVYSFIFRSLNDMREG